MLGYFQVFITFVRHSMHKQISGRDSCTRAAVLSQLAVLKRCVYVIYLCGYELSLSLSLLLIICHCYCLISVCIGFAGESAYLNPFPTPWATAECRRSRNCQRPQMQMRRSTTNRAAIETTANASWPRVPSAPGNGLLSVATNWCVCECEQGCACSTFFIGHR